MKEAAVFFGVLGAFVAFLDEHKRCGDLDGDHGYVSCSCGAQIVHAATTPPTPIQQ